MDEEELEEYLQKEHKIRDAGFIDREHFNTLREHVVNGMLAFGDEFFQCFAKTLKVASDNDALKLLRYWHHDADKYEFLDKMFLAKKAATCEK
jgi:hypothetical protein